MLRQNQNGFASIVIAIVLVLVLSLMTVGFAQLMRNEERSALDRHLSSQAYYAAESGINDALKAIKAGFGANGEGKTDCTGVPAQPGAGNIDPAGKVGNDPNIAYTCLLINPTPLSLRFGDVGETRPTYVQLTGVDPANPQSVQTIQDVVISWQQTDPPRTDNPADQFVAPTADRKFDTKRGWDDKEGILRVGITPLGTITRQALIDSTYTAFMYPVGAGGPVDATDAGNLDDLAPNPYAAHKGRAGAGGIVDGACHVGSRPYKCNVRIAGINSSKLLFDLRSIYKKSTVEIYAYGDTGQRLGIKDAQTVIDSTGKAHDVLRRVQVRVPTKGTYKISPFSLEAGAGICKQLALTPGGGTNECDTP